MKKHIAPLLLAMTLLSSCSHTTTEDTVIESVTATTTTTYTVTASPTTDTPEPEPTIEEPAPIQEQAPIQEPEETHIIEEKVTQLPSNYSEEDYLRDTNKVVSHCGIHGIEEVGTTWFTDGTTGWTQYCADEMISQVPQQAPPAYSEEPAPIPYEEPSQMYNQYGEPVSDWVQDQIRWSACIEAGNTQQYCNTH